MIHGPGSPGVLAQMITGGEKQVDWVTGVIGDLDRGGYVSIDTTPEAEQAWGAEMAEMASKTLYQHANSWYVGANIPGKPRYFMIYIGGFDQYQKRCDEQVGKGYEGFVLAKGRRGGTAGRAG
jgi:hypothetical protein